MPPRAGRVHSYSGADELTATMLSPEASIAAKHLKLSDRARRDLDEINDYLSALPIREPRGVHAKLNLHLERIAHTGPAVHRETTCARACVLQSTDATTSTSASLLLRPSLFASSTAHAMFAACSSMTTTSREARRSQAFPAGQTRPTTFPAAGRTASRSPHNAEHGPLPLCRDLAASPAAAASAHTGADAKSRAPPGRGEQASFARAGRARIVLC